MNPTATGIGDLRYTVTGVQHLLHGELSATFAPEEGMASSKNLVPTPITIKFGNAEIAEPFKLGSSWNVSLTPRQS